MKVFIFTYWKELAYLLVCLFVIIFTLLTRKVKTVDTVKEIILEVLPRFITSVERPGDGKAKMKEVVSCVLAYLSKLYPDVDFSKYITFIKQSVENILKTPQRK